MTFHYRHRKQIILAIAIVLMIVLGLSGTIYFYEPKKKKTISSIKKEEIKEEEKEVKEPKEIEFMVDVKGEVITPGIYNLSSTSRIIDAINKAGGLTDDADTTVINLSKKIEDEMVIIIYSKDEVKNWLETKEEEAYLQEKCLEPREGQAENNACIEDTKEQVEQTGQININTATKEELMTLNGIGEAKADAIISYREQTPFTKIEDIKNVSGIGDSIYEEIKDKITV